MKVPLRGPRKLFESDATVQALAVAMQANCETMAFLEAEGAIFETISGLYTEGAAQVELFLRAYGGEYFSESRITREGVTLEHPIITFGLSVQPEVIFGLRSMIKQKLRGRGLFGRFLYGIPTELARATRNRNTRDFQ